MEKRTTTAVRILSIPAELLWYIGGASGSLGTLGSNDKTRRKKQLESFQTKYRLFF